MVLLALGEPEDFSGESQSRTQIVVPAAQEKLAEAVAQCGKPVAPWWCLVLGGSSQVS